MNMKKKVAIQGVKGAFHEEAARRYFGEGVEVVSVTRFEDELELLRTGVCEFAVMALENTISGTILNNYELIRNADVSIVGEVKLRIRQNLGVVPGTSIDQLKEVHSHYMALSQCSEFLSDYPHVDQVEATDTATSVQNVARNGDSSVAAIGSKLAIDYYGLELLEESIETDDRNYTRFAILAPGGYRMEGDKVSLSLVLKHEKGALVRAISLLDLLGANLTKIESAPVLGSPFQYRFYLDFVMEGILSFDLIIEALRPLTIELKIIGRYSPIVLSED